MIGKMWRKRYKTYGILCGYLKFVEIIKNDFPNAGNYMGDKSNIGLGV